MPPEHAEITSAELLEWQERGAQVVDVREEYELLNGVVPGAVSLPLSRFLDGLADLPAAPLVFVCAAGVRSRDAAAYLARQGFEHEVANLSGGMQEWRSEGREVGAFSEVERVGSTTDGAASDATATSGTELS